jgi:hypothetical protein
MSPMWSTFFAFPSSCAINLSAPLGSNHMTHSAYSSSKHLCSNSLWHIHREAKTCWHNCLLSSTCKSSLQIRVTTNFSRPNRMSLDDSRLFNNYILCKWEFSSVIGNLLLSIPLSLLFINFLCGNLTNCGMQ